MERDADLLTVRDFMNAGVVALPADLPIDDALGRLDADGFSGAPVVDGGRVVGILSQLDCTRVLAAAAYDEMPVGTVRDHMTSHPTWVRPDDDVFSVVQTFLTTGFRRLPVCDGAGALVGLVTLSDLGRALRTVQQRRDAVHTRKPPPGAAWDPQISAERDRKG